MKHLPFDSIYRPDFEVVEQREGNVSFYPHTEQLPLLLRALNFEFLGGLPNRIAYVDAKSDGFRKVMRRMAASMFCNSINSARSDRLRLFALLNPDLVAKVSIVQQITEFTRRGPCHRFRFYAGDDFFPEIYLSGKRLVFADHVLQRFSARVPSNANADVMNFLLSFFGTPLIALPVGQSRAFIVPHHESVLAFTYKESDTEYFMTTCLTVHEINSLHLEIPPQAFNLHYGAAFTPPEYRNWVPLNWMKQQYDHWKAGNALPPPTPALKRSEWHRFGSFIKDMQVKRGHGPGSKLSFLDDIPGPCCLVSLPGQQCFRYNELESLKQHEPNRDWQAIIAGRDAEARRTTPTPDES